MRYLALVAFSIQALFSIPLLIGALAETLHFKESQLGGIAAADLAGFSLACLWVFLQASRLSWRHLLTISAIGVIAANLVCTITEDFLALISLRALAGFGSGVVYSIAMVAIGNSYRSTSLFGWGMAAQALVSIAYLTSLPHLLDHFGLPVVYWLLSIMAMVCGLMALGLEPENIVQEKTNEIPPRTDYLPGATVLLGIFALYLGQGGYTAFIERIGSDSGIGDELIGYALAASSFAGFVAGIAAALQAQKLGLRFPLFLIFAGQVLAIWMLFEQHNSPWTYMLALVIYNFCWTYAVPYHMSIVANQVAGERLVALAPAVQAGGLAVGAACSGFLLEAASNYGVLYAFIVFTGLLSLVLVARFAATGRSSTTPLGTGAT